ncbi:hypothetical protein [Paractinoplanes aksuensis]|uniref:hypothetical protein n=1 Tax=Paractinoplanes aksuensis TaxID=2939490 RepID=UPI003F68CEA1
MIQTKGLTKRYGKTDSVRDVTFTAAPGRVTGDLPFTTFMSAAGGNPEGLLLFSGYALVALGVAAWFIRRDLTD